MDIRISFFGSVTENVPAQAGDQAAWLEKWGWVPRYQGSTGLSDAAALGGSSGDPVPTQATVHGPTGALGGTQNPNNTTEQLGNGIRYEFDDRAILPYARNATGAIQYDQPIRQDAYGRTLPLVPRLPVSQGLLFYGENPVRD
jgi:hypothetical protein